MPDALVSQAVKELYAALDAGLAEHLKQFKITCKRGCAHCCYLLTGVTAAEALPIAEKLFDREDWAAVVDRLSVAAKQHFFDRVTRRRFLEKRIPCVFLDLKTNDCEIYEQRPAACRYHFVVSDPEFCRPDHPTGRTARINIQEHITKYVFELAEQVQKPVVAAPLAVMVLHCMELISRQDPEIHAVLERATDGVPDPSEWMRRYGDKVADEEDEDVKRQPKLLTVL